MNDDYVRGSNDTYAYVRKILTLGIKVLRKQLDESVSIDAQIRLKGQIDALKDTRLVIWRIARRFKGDTKRASRQT